jgi:hypothetical protein
MKGRTSAVPEETVVILTLLLSPNLADRLNVCWKPAKGIPPLFCYLRRLMVSCVPYTICMSVRMSDLNRKIFVVNSTVSTHLCDN